MKLDLLEASYWIKSGIFASYSSVVSSLPLFETLFDFLPLDFLFFLSISRSRLIIPRPPAPAPPCKLAAAIIAKFALVFNTGLSFLPSLNVPPNSAACYGDKLLGRC